MRSLLENSALQRSVLFVLIIISFFIGVMLFVNHNQEKRYLPHMLVDVVFLVISYLEFNTVVITMAHVFGDKVITGWRMELAQKPFVLYLAAAVVITIIQVLRIQEDNKWRRNHLSLSSVKESIDLMPYGICYYYESGMPRLINKEMQQISIDIFGERISNAADFWENINQKKSTVNARRLEESEIPTWICDEKKVWSFSREKISFEKGYLYEILATDITEEYEMNQRLAKENERVKVLSGKLKEYSQNVTRLTIEKEVLEAKIRIHAELGQTLVATRRYLAAKDIDRAEMLRLWKKNISLLKKEDTDNSRSDYELLKINAEQLGISLSLPEALPTDAETKDIIISAVGECITNAYKYAESKELKLTVSEDEGRRIICIVNEGEHPAGKIEEKGGLLSLRKKLEKNGGTMEVKEEPCFTLTITMEKRKFI